MQLTNSDGIYLVKFVNSKQKQLNFDEFSSRQRELMRVCLTAIIALQYLYGKKNCVIIHLSKTTYIHINVDASKNVTTE